MKQRKEGTPLFLYNIQDIDPAVHTWIFYVGGKTEEDALINISGLLRQFKNGTVQQEGHPYTYNIVMQSYNITKTDVQFYYEVSVSCECIKIGDKITIIANDDALYSYSGDTYDLVFDNPGTAIVDMGMRYEPTDWDEDSGMHRDEEHTIRIGNKAADYTTFKANKDSYIVLTPETGYSYVHSADTDLLTFSHYQKTEPGQNRLRIDGLTHWDIIHDRLTFSFIPVYL